MYGDVIEMGGGTRHSGLAPREGSGCAVSAGSSPASPMRKVTGGSQCLWAKPEEFFFRILTRVWIRPGRKELPSRRQQSLEREFLRLVTGPMDTHVYLATRQLAGWTC